MELTFLKLAQRRGGGGGGSEREREAKKIEAAERSLGGGGEWTGVMAVLELRYQSPDPFATPPCSPLSQR